MVLKLEGNLYDIWIGCLSPIAAVMTVEYACVFGISSPIKGLEAGNQITCFNNGWSILSIIGKGGRIYWFLMLKLEQKYTADNAPRFTHEDALRRCEKLCGAHYWKNIRFGDVWKRREVFSMTNLEESLFQTWHGHRVVCIGDSMHKVDPTFPFSRFPFQTIANEDGSPCRLPQIQARVQIQPLKMPLLSPTYFVGPSRQQIVSRSLLGQTSITSCKSSRIYV